MAVSTEVRQQRVAEGSNRKRDLAATKFNHAAYAAKHFPGEHPGYVEVAAWAERTMKRGTYPDPKAVRARLEAKGWTLAQREAL